MRSQPAGGHIFNIDGAGADGSPTPQYAAYGATKAGDTQPCHWHSCLPVEDKCQSLPVIQAMGVVQLRDKTWRQFLHVPKLCSCVTSPVMPPILRVCSPIQLRLMGFCGLHASSSFLRNLCLRDFQLRSTSNAATFTVTGIAHLMGSLNEEIDAEGSPVGVHTLSPGMVLTPLLLEGATDRNKAIFNILCEQPETVAAFLTPRIR